MSLLPELDLFKIQTNSLTLQEGSFVLAPLSPGYGTTIGNALRRVLLSSLPGAAITAVRVNDAAHEFTTLPGATEDLIEIIMNLKQVRLKLHGEDSTALNLSLKGPKTVTAADFFANPQVDVMTKDQVIATVAKNHELRIEARVEIGRGYLPTERRKEEKLPLNMIAIDAIFTPIRKVNFVVENTRVGQETNFDKLTLDVTTDGTINPADAIKQAAQILAEHFSNIASVQVPSLEPKKEPKKTSKAKRR